MKKCSFKRNNNCINNRGMTLVEMIVSFALLAIFLASAAAIIGTITSMYFEIKGENYSRQVSDIILEKIESEIDGAKFESGGTINEPKIQKSITGNDEVGVDEGPAIVLTDKTDTKLKMYSDNGELVIHYYPIGDSYGSTDWKFDKSVYNHFTIDELIFVKGDKLGSSGVDCSEFGLDNPGTYGPDIMVVFLKIHSARYGDYYSYRFVKMYNYTE